MPEDILSPAYWRQRLATAKERHQSIFKCDLARWERIEAKHRQILIETIHPEVSVLDAGCGYGRLLTLMPADWRGFYFGVDISPDFVELARQEHPDRTFSVGDLRHLRLQDGQFDWSVLISVRPMVRRNLGDVEWDKMEYELKRVSKRLLFLEYDEEDGGEVVTSEILQGAGK